MEASMPISKILSLTLIFSIFLHPSHSDLSNPQDKEALLQIKRAFNNPRGLELWNPKTDCCKWPRVQCNKITHRINFVTFNYAILKGPIPPQIGDLPSLEILDFHKNYKLTGPIPPAIAKLKRLRQLLITWTSISGSIPDFIGDLENLKDILLYNNKLSGPIPISIGTLKNLQMLHLDNNNLTGLIPDLFVKSKGKDLYLDLGHNQLSGEIPASLGKNDFTYIDLSRNRLEGDASTLFGSEKSTWYLNVSRNLFEFDFSNVTFSNNLVVLDISHNNIFGSLPEVLTKLDIQLFNVSYNRLCGQIPQGGNLQKFDASAYAHNRCLCGAPLPSCNRFMAA